MPLDIASAANIPLPENKSKQVISLLTPIILNIDSRIYDLVGLSVGASLKERLLDFNEPPVILSL
tara:strand:+ start:142 stop:336 length:195 start_codon:yes stop_codon:yes gene_type:complete